jgi:hypothetical protein
MKLVRIESSNQLRLVDGNLLLQLDLHLERVAVLLLPSQEELHALVEFGEDLILRHGLHWVHLKYFLSLRVQDEGLVRYRLYIINLLLLKLVDGLSLWVGEGPLFEGRLHTLVIWLFSGIHQN